jgi:ATP-dependent Lon protease
MDDAPIADPIAAKADARPVPTDAFIVVPVRTAVLFPEVVMPITINRPISIAAAQQAAREQRQIVVVLQRDPDNADPSKAGDLHEIGVVANVLRYIAASDTEHHLICQGVQRFRISDLVDGWPFLLAHGLHVPEPTDAGSEVEARFVNLRQQALEILDLVPQAPAELRATIAGISLPGVLADMSAAYLDAAPPEKQDILETIPLVPRLDKIIKLTAHRLQVLRLSHASARRCCASSWPPSSASWARTRAAARKSPS